MSDENYEDEICEWCDGVVIDCQCRDKDDLPEDDVEIVEIKLTDSISFQSDISKEELKKYLKPLMSVEDLGDCLFVKKICKPVTYKIELTDDSPSANITSVTKINDEQNNKISEKIFS